MFRDSRAAAGRDYRRQAPLMIAVVTARRAVRSAALWGAVFALYLASSAIGYATTYPTVSERGRLAATFGSNAGVNALIGPAHAIDTVAGFTAWRGLGVLGLVGAVWGLLIGTRLLRGEEEAGRWELLLAGRTTRRRAAGQALAGLAAGWLALFCVPAVVLIAVGRAGQVRFAPTAAAFDVLAVASNAAVFLCVGALAGELAPTRRRAAGYAGAVLGVAYALRMIADSGTGLQALRWATPLGWAEELRPLTGSRPFALLPLGALTALAAVLTLLLAGRRDFGASAIADRATARPRVRLLTGPAGLTVRLVRGTTFGWSTAVAISGVVLGLIAKSAGDALADSSGAAGMLARLGARGGGARAYLGVAFLVVALLVALVAAGAVTAARDEEATGRLEALLVRPVPRRSWLLARTAVATAALLAMGVLAAASTWVGTTSQHTGITFPTLLDAGLNLLPPAAVVLGAGLLTLGLWPRGVSVVAYGLLAWSFLVELVGSVVSANHWLLDTSLFHHMAPAPAANANWTANLALVAVGMLCGAVGLARFTRRDLTGE